MNIDEKDTRETARSREVMRLMQLTRDEGIENLLDAALAGRAKTVESVTKLYHFVLRTFGDTAGFTPSTVTRRFWAACSSFLKDAGLTQEQLAKIQRPHPVAGDPDFISVIDEFREQGF